MQRSDTVLKQVMAAFEHESHLKLHNHPIHMSLDGNALTVSGEVPDIASKKRLLSLTHAHSGGVPLVDRLLVAAHPPMGDGELRTRICERLAQASKGSSRCCAAPWIRPATRAAARSR